MSNGAYRAAYDESLADPDAFWGRAAQAIDWITPPPRVLDDDRPPFYRWFTGGTLNTCFNALDRHVIAGRGDQAALHYDSPVAGTQQTFTYADLLDRVATFAGALASLGVAKGDRVIVYMPMVPEAVIAMLACARLGAVHSVVFGGFAPTELAARIEDAKPTVIVSASCGIEPSRIVEYKPMLDAALDRSTHKPESVVVLQREQARAAVGERDTDWEELDWAELVADAEPADCVEVGATDPLYILYTSGTTGRPKGIVRDNGGHAVALRWSMENVYGIGPGDSWFTASDVGWVVGHSYIVYAPLLTGATSVLYEGKPVGTPDASAFWRIIEQYGVKAMFTAPTAYRAIRREDPEGTLIAAHDLSSLQTVFLAGERLDPDTWEWATKRLGVPVVDNWWQTETGWPIASNLRGLEPMPLKPGSPTVPTPG
ncbi:MAG: AMP-binding protein, partial [Pedococcus sp.]